MTKKVIEGQEAEFVSRRYYPIYNDYQSGSYPMDYNLVWTRPNLMYVLEIEQWDFINNPNKPVHYHKDKYLECTLLDTNKQKINKLNNFWGLNLKTRGNHSKPSALFDWVRITLTDKYSEEKVFDREATAHYISKVLKEVSQITQHQNLIHYNYSLQIQDLQQQINNLSTTKNTLQSENERIKQENFALCERVKKLEEFAAKVEKMTGKLVAKNK